MAVDFGVDATVLLAVVCLAIAAVVGAVIFFVNQLKKETSQTRQKPASRVRDDGSSVPARAAARRRGGRDRMRRQANRTDDYSDDEDELPREEIDDQGETKKIGAKKARKLEMKEEKKAQRQAELEEREERKRRQELIDEQRRKDEEREKQEEEEREAEEQRRKEEEEKREYEEYLKLKEAFTVEEEGHEQILSEQESQNLLQEFIDYIKQMKVVVLEDLGAQFNIRTQEAIKRVQDLQEQGRLTGVIDDRGKFIYISLEELEGVAKFIRQRGRVSISELADASNTLITLNPENKDTYQKKLLGEVQA